MPDGYTLYPSKNLLENPDILPALIVFLIFTEDTVPFIDNNDKGNVCFLIDILHRSCQIIPIKNMSKSGSGFQKIPQNRFS